MSTLRSSQSLTTFVSSTSPDNRGYRIIKRIVSQPSLPAQPSAPRLPSKFNLQIINLPNPDNPVLHKFQAEVLSEFGTALTPTQITALRCYHPALRQYDNVYFSIVGACQYIVVCAASLNKAVKNRHPLPLKIGGYQVHFFPDEFYKPEDYIIAPNLDLINTTIDPHRLLEPKIAAILQRYFTLSIGVRLLVFGHLVILFPDTKSLQWTRSHITVPLKIGNLTYSFDVLCITPTVNDHPATGRSDPTSLKPEDPTAHNIIDPPMYSRTAPIIDRYNFIDPEFASCALGVKIHIPERDVIAWTSLTHAWAQIEQPKRSWKTPLTEVVRRLVFWKKSGRGKAVGQTKISGADALGKVIYYEGTREVIGTVSHIYDSPSVGLPYPQGYRHDLALITGPNLPVFSQPPNCARLLTTFATPEEALSAGTVFQLMSDFRRSKPGTLDVVNGHVVPRVARDALIMGVQSSWDYTEHMETTNSLIWRSDPDDKRVQGASGSLLCLGSNADETVKGLVFQNFQGGYYGRHWQAADEGHEEISGADSMATFKGGFFLPNEVQVGTIIVDAQEETRRVFSGKGPEPALRVHVEQKRNFTA